MRRWELLARVVVVATIWLLAAEDRGWVQLTDWAHAAITLELLIYVAHDFYNGS